MFETWRFWKSGLSPVQFGLASFRSPHFKTAYRNVRREQPAWSEPDLKTCYFKVANSCVLGDLEITEVGFARRGFVRPKHQHRAPILGGVRTMLLAGLDVN